MNKNLLKKSVLVVCVLVSSSLFAETFLGDTKLARHHTDLDVIKTNKCGLSEIQLRVSERPADIFHVYVEYGNGNFDELEVRDNIRRGGRTRWINLRGQSERCITKIAVIGESDGLRGKKALISVFGR